MAGRSSCVETLRERSDAHPLLICGVASPSVNARTLTVDVDSAQLNIAVIGTIAGDALSVQPIERNISYLGKLAQPRRFGHVDRAARDLLDMAGIDEDQLKVVFEAVPHRLPCGMTAA
jgi:hypothetical protein